MAAKYFIPEATPLAMPTNCRSVNCPSFFLKRKSSGQCWITLHIFSLKITLKKGGTFKKLSKDPFAMYSMTIMCGMPKIQRDFCLNLSHHLGRHVMFCCTTDAETIVFCKQLQLFCKQL